TDGAFVTHEAVAFDNYAKKQRIVIAVGRGRHDAQPVSARFALHPELLSGPAPESDKSGLQGFGVAHRVQESQHKHLASLEVLHNAWNQAIHLFEIDCCLRVAHSLPDHD